MDPNGSAHRLALGHIRIRTKLFSLWATLTHSCQVEFRYGANVPVPQERRDRFVLMAPFCYLYNAPNKSSHLALESLVVYYFVIAGKWSHFPNGGRKQVSLSTLQQACKEVMSGMAAISEISDEEKMEWELPPVKTEDRTAAQLKPPRPPKRKHDNSQSEKPTKRLATATAKEELLEVEVNAKEAQLAEMSKTVGKVLDAAEVHANWASDMFEKNIPQAHQDAAKMQLDNDIKELRSIAAEFRELYGKRV